MPGLKEWVVVAAVGAFALILWRYLRVMSARQRHILRMLDELHQAARHDAEVEQQVEQLLAQAPEEKARRRRLHTVPPAAFAALAMFGVWLKANWGAVTGTTVAAAGMGVLLTFNPAEQRSADPPTPVEPVPTETRAPSLTTPLPSVSRPSVTSTTRRATPAAVTEPLRPPTSMLTTTTSMPTTTTLEPPVTVPPPVPSMPVDECVVQVDLGKLLEVCLPR